MTSDGLLSILCNKQEELSNLPILLMSANFALNNFFYSCIIDLVGHFMLILMSKSNNPTYPSTMQGEISRLSIIIEIWEWIIAQKGDIVLPTGMDKLVFRDQAESMFWFSFPVLYFVSSQARLQRSKDID